MLRMYVDGEDDEVRVKSAIEKLDSFARSALEKFANLVKSENLVICWVMSANGKSGFVDGRILGTALLSPVRGFGSFEKSAGAKS